MFLFICSALLPLYFQIGVSLNVAMVQAKLLIKYIIYMIFAFKEIVAIDWWASVLHRTFKIKDKFIQSNYTEILATVCRANMNCKNDIF